MKSVSSARSGRSVRSVLFAAAWLVAATAAPARDKPDLGHYELGKARAVKVLYAGVPDTPRAQVFLEFLKQNFDAVASIDVEKLSKEAAAPYDVVVCDGRRLYPMDMKGGLQIPKCALGPDFTKPIVMIASMGGSVQHHTKIGWL
jgi:hypothetical protein